MAIRVHKENANKQGRELCGGRNNHRRVKKGRRQRGTTQESWVSAKREKRTRWARKRDKHGEETAVKSCQDRISGGRLHAPMAPRLQTYDGGRDGADAAAATDADAGVGTKERRHTTADKTETRRKICSRAAGAAAAFHAAAHASVCII